MPSLDIKLFLNKFFCTAGWISEIFLLFDLLFFCLSVSSSRISVFSRFQKPSLPWLWLNRRCKIDVKFLSYGTSLCTSWIIGPISPKKTREQLYFPLLWRLKSYLEFRFWDFRSQKKLLKNAICWDLSTSKNSQSHK